MVFEQLYPIFDMIFSPLTILPHYVSVLILSSMLTMLVLSINRLLVNKDVAKSIRTKMEEIKENLNQAQKLGDKENVNKLINEMMKTNNEYMKHTLKALVVSMLVISLILPWVGEKYKGLTVASLPFNLPFVGHSFDWLLWYFLVSLTLGWIANKMFGVS
ncbi:MAG: DUF106 domain-containing protein [Candidatus Aenigmarchaeota archaeon]|nr:DUF106 domain-containing protein [Candidatus Aenigmarchaeota archaeon]